MTFRTLLLVAAMGFTIGAVHASTLFGPFPESQPPDTFGGCAGCTQLAYQSETGNNATSSLHLTFNSAVYTDPSNTFCAGCLDFVYQVVNGSGSTDSVSRITISSFASVADVDAGYSTAGEPAAGGTAFPPGTWAPGTVDRNTADTIGFQFSNVATAIPPGGTSVVLIIETNSVTFTAGLAGVSDGTGATFGTFAAQSATPEPAAALLAGLGMMGLAGLRLLRLRR